ncbi:hypothetical protein Leryth_020855, partial [Lithospermum erythrorhizon]
MRKFYSFTNNHALMFRFKCIHYSVSLSESNSLIISITNK